MLSSRGCQDNQKSKRESSRAVHQLFMSPTKNRVVMLKVGLNLTPPDPQVSHNGCRQLASSAPSLSTCPHAFNLGRRSLTITMRTNSQENDRTQHSATPDAPHLSV
jgi:hypothetical protein